MYADTNERSTGWWRVGVFVVSGVAAVGLLVASGLFYAGDVHAPTREASYGTSCGSAYDVARTRSTYRGGEYRLDQEAFDKKCAEKADRQVAVAKNLGFSALAFLAVTTAVAIWLVIDRRARRRAMRRS